MKVILFFYNNPPVTAYILGQMITGPIDLLLFIYAVMWGLHVDYSKPMV